METYQAIILGVVQGLTELLPISSSGHLYLISDFFFNWDIPDAFDIALHFGTLLAICIFFFKDWLNLFKGAYEKVVHKKDSLESKIFFYMVIGTIPAGIIGLIFDKCFEDTLRHPLIVAGALIIMGILLYVVDKKSKSEYTYETMTFKQSFLIGISQVLAFIPGVSRSGATITVGRALKVDRESAAKFSFYLSAPVVLGACVLQLLDDGAVELIMQNATIFILGIVVSFVTGLICIKFLLQYLKKHDFKLFMIYRIILALIVIITVIL